MRKFFPAYDDAILLYIQKAVRRPWLTPVMVLLSVSGMGGCVWICWAHFLYFHGMKAQCDLILIAFYTANVLNDLVLKRIVKRPRPWVSCPDITQTYLRPRDSSWPSGHTACGFSVAFAMLLSGVPFAGAGLLLAAAIAFSRMYNGHHYLSDVIGGFLEALVLLPGMAGIWFVILT